MDKQFHRIFGYLYMPGLKLIRFNNMGPSSLIGSIKLRMKSVSSHPYASHLHIMMPQCPVALSLDAIIEVGASQNALDIFGFSSQNFNLQYICL